ncbi:MAG: hypothetical protein NTW60_01265 [Candidatus Wolfebacteria bacterium]|nr:hypothetical protein [Candidatus Wolfebacteria bacterium]
MLNFKIKTILLVFLGFLPVFFIPSVNAQTSQPQFLVTWKTKTYAPAWYQGKILGTKDSGVQIGFELIDNGKSADLSKTIVRWYINDQVKQNENNGLGIKNLNFQIPDYRGQETSVRISLPDYKGTALDKIVKIPVAAPETVIDWPHLNRYISAGDNYFAAAPFFFNVADLNSLSFDWSLNNQTFPGDTNEPWTLKLDIDSTNMPQDFIINLNSTVKNYQNEMEFASQNLRLQVK